MNCQNTSIDDLQNIARDLFVFDQEVRPQRTRKIKIRKEKDQQIDKDHHNFTKGDSDEVDFQLPIKDGVPGVAKIFVKTFGCAHNISDSQFMMGQLMTFGYQIVNQIQKCDLVLVNSCTVKNPSQDSFLEMVKNATKIRKPLVVAGCVPQADRQIKQIKQISTIGTNQIDRVVEVVQQTLKGNVVQLLEKNRLPSLDLPKVRKNRLTINTGCLGACTYCKTVHARGRLGSYTKQALISRTKSAIEEGVTQIWMSSQDTGAYGLDIGQSITTLLQGLIPQLKQHTMLRIGMTNPPYMLANLQAIARALNHPRVYSFIHIPVQSGNDQVLTNMNRQYTVQEFQKVCDFLLAKVPGLTIATDIICGFPGQTDEQFQDTLNLLQKYKFRVVNISQFYPRPGTAAARMERVPTKKVKQRSTRISTQFKSYSDRHSLMLGKREKVYVSQKQQIKGNLHMVGHTKNYTKVVLPYDQSLMGKSVFLEVKSVFPWHVEGVICEQPVLPQKIVAFKAQPQGFAMKGQESLWLGVCCLIAGIVIKLLSAD